MNIALIIGGVAAVASMTSFVPQAVKIVRTRDTKSISTGMYAITVAGFALWTSYGALNGAWPLIASNGVCFLLSGFILTMKLLPRDRKEAVAESLAPIVGDEPAGGGA